MSLKKTEASDRIVLCDSFVLCLGAGIYIYTYIYTYMCVYIYMYVCTHIYMLWQPPEAKCQWLQSSNLSISCWHSHWQCLNRAALFTHVHCSLQPSRTCKGKPSKPWCISPGYPNREVWATSLKGGQALLSSASPQASKRQCWDFTASAENWEELSRVEMCWQQDTL